MSRGRTVALLALLVCASCGNRAGPSATDAAGGDSDRGAGLPDGRADEAGCGPAPPATTLDLPYATVAGVAPALLSLDLYAPPRADRCQPAPVVVWVHGGGWATGDKRNKMRDKVALLNGAGYLLVSVNYRLSPTEPTMAPDRIMHPTHVQDVAAALDWVLRHAAEHGGDPQRLAVLGHSAGAHLAALVSTDAQHLARHGHGLTAIRCAGALDTEGYDLQRALADASEQQRTIFENAFGTDPATLAAASPQQHVAAGAGIPPFLLAKRGTASRQALAEAFAAALEAAGVRVEVVDATGLSHEQVNDAVGQAGDTVITPPLVSFLADCLGAP